jgi:hypothetical protein
MWLYSGHPYPVDDLVESTVHENGHAEKELICIHCDSDSDWWFDVCAKEGAMGGSRDACWS